MVEENRESNPQRARTVWPCLPGSRMVAWISGVVELGTSAAMPGHLHTWQSACSRRATTQAQPWLADANEWSRMASDALVLNRAPGNYSAVSCTRCMNASLSRT